MNKKAVIFDMDGVICHTNPYHSIAFRAFFEKRGVNPSDAEFAVHMFGKSNSYILQHFLGRKVEGEEFIAMENEKEGLFREIYAEHVETIPNYMEFLNDLHANDFLTGVATSAPKANLELIKNKVGFGPMMGSILASEDVSKHKPDPEVYLTSAKNLGVTADQCVVFEDSFSGVSAAINAKMKVVGVLSSHSKKELPPCDAYINEYSEISAKDIKELLK